MQNAKEKATPRRRRTRSEWAQILERFEASGKTPTDFCRAEKLGLANFLRWRKLFDDRAHCREAVPSNPRFIELETPPPLPQPSRWRVELALGDGVVLRLNCDPSS